MSQEALVTYSDNILSSVVEDGYWDASISAPALRVLDGVIDASGGSSGIVVSSDDMRDDVAEK